MRRLHDLKPTLRCLKSFGCAALLSIAALEAVAAPQLAEAQEPDENARVMWNIRYADGLDKATRDEVQNTLLSTLARGRERHFATQPIITQKLKSEGLQIPSCFEDGGPCASGPSFLLDVHQVDIYVDALFNKVGDEWQIELKLFKRFASSSNTITQTGKNLANLLNTIIGSLFVLESSIDITSEIPDVEVWLNQKLIGTTPLSMKITEGPQKLVFKKDGYFSGDWSFTAQKGAIHSHYVELSPETTQFTVVTTDEEAEILVDGAEWGHSGDTHEILPGNHNISIKSAAYHPYEQDLTIYAGGPQTMQVSLLPNSRDIEDIRADGIKRYRFSATGGYHFGIQKFGMGSNNTIRIKKTHPTPADIESGNYGYKHVSAGSKNQGDAYAKFADTSFHGMSFAFNYENEFWGITLARLDLLGSAYDGLFGLYENQGGQLGNTGIGMKGDGGTLIGFYPAQLKAHYNFWVMQVELQAGVGVSWTKLKGVQTNAIDMTGTTDYEDLKVAFSRTQFSANFDLGLKYFFTEETFAMLSYGLQIDSDGRDDTTLRHGMTIAFGIQIPMAMRDKKLQATLDETAAETAQTIADAQNASGNGDAANAEASELVAPIVDDVDDVEIDAPDTLTEVDENVAAAIVDDVDEEDEAWLNSDAAQEADHD